MGVFVMLVIVVIGLVLVLAQRGRAERKRDMLAEKRAPTPLYRPIAQDYPPEQFSRHRAVRSEQAAYPEDKTIAVTAASFRIEYLDGGDAPTQRRIDIKGFSEFDGKIYLEAWCHLRRAMRSFRADRVLEMTSLQTGEVISDVSSYAPSLRRMLFDPGKDYASLLAKARPGLSALIWIARADYDLSDEEMDILGEYAMARDELNRKRAEPADCNAMTLRKWIENARPTLDEAAGALAQMKAGGSERQLVQRFGRQLAVLDEAAAKRFRKLGLSDLDV